MPLVFALITLAQQAATTPTAQAAAAAATQASGTLAGEFTGSMVLAWVCANLIEWAKGSKLLPWITATTPQINRVVSWVVALGATLGVHATFDAHAGALTITGLTWIGLRDSGMEYARQLMFQSIAYRKFLDPGAK